jgi:hypothetical protein
VFWVLLCQSRQRLRHTLWHYCDVAIFEPPDIAVGTGHQRREEVIQDVYDKSAATAPVSPPL